MVITVVSLTLLLKLHIILLTFFTWLSKHELQNFVKFESSSNSIDTTAKSSFETFEMTGEKNIYFLKIKI